MLYYLVEILFQRLVFFVLCAAAWAPFFSYYKRKDDLCSLVKYPSKSRERHLQKISLDERYVRPKCLWCYFSFFAVEQWKPTQKNVIS